MPYSSPYKILLTKQERDELERRANKYTLPYFRTARLRCDWRSFARAKKTRFESVGIVIGGNRSDAEAKYD